MIDKISNVANQPTDLQVTKVKSVQNVEVNKQQSESKIELSREKAEKVVNSINEFLKDSSTQLVFKYHEGLQEYYVTVVDENTNEVIKEIPSRKLLDIYAAMKEYTGMLVDKKA